MFFQVASFIFVNFDIEKITYFQLYFSLKDFAYDVSFLAIKNFCQSLKILPLSKNFLNTLLFQKN